MFLLLFSLFQDFCKRLDDEFIFTISKNELICKNPTGQSYTIQLSDIESLKVIEDNSDGGCESWYIITGTEEFEILYNYNNPVRNIIDYLQSELKEIRITKN